jgi:hypothetical protein
MTSPRAAGLGAPPAKPVQRNLLGDPPTPGETKGNINKGKVVQLNVRVDPDKHAEIKIASIKERMELQDYMVMVHDFYQQHKGQKRA